MHTRGINSVFVLDFAIEVSLVPMFQKQSIGDAFYPKRYSHPRRCVIMAYLLRGYRHSGLVMYFSTLPAPSASAPCILAILTHLRMRVKICILTPPPFLLKILLAPSSVFALPTKPHHHCLIHRNEWLYCNILHSYSSTVKTWTFQTNQDRKPFVYPTNILVSRTGFVRCPRPCATSSTAADNEAYCFF